MVGPLKTAEYVHGDSGLEGWGPAVDARASGSTASTSSSTPSWRGRRARSPSSPGLGLTNIAMALVKEPRIAPRIREIVLLGSGYFEGGNITPSAEFNIFVDLGMRRKGCRLHLGLAADDGPIDCTYWAVLTPLGLKRLRGLGTLAALAAAGMAEFYQRYGNQKFDGPLSAARLLRDRLPAEAGDVGEDVLLKIEIASPLTMVATVVDWWNVIKRLSNWHGA